MTHRRHGRFTGIMRSPWTATWAVAMAPLLLLVAVSASLDQPDSRSTVDPKQRSHVVGHTLSTSSNVYNQTTFTVFRITPIDVTGLTNLDSGDAAGDIFFGVAQLSLPQLCLYEPSMIWCANRDVLSGSGQHMVYTEFSVTAWEDWGRYSRCNPCATSKDGGSVREKPLCPMLPNGTHAPNGTFVCEDPTPQVGRGLNQPMECSAEADVASILGPAGSKPLRFPPPPPSYLNCVEELHYDCESSMNSEECNACAFNKTVDPHRGMSTYDRLTKYDGCTDTYLKDACSFASAEVCEKAIEKVCTPHSSDCFECIREHESSVEEGKCRYSTIEEVCELPPSPSRRWMGYVGRLGCLMQGYWYSTTSLGKCPEKNLTDDCYWYIEETKRTVNASCVDANVINAIQNHNRSCWAGCPGNDGKNVSSACYLTCLFETVLGNRTTGVAPMNKTVLETAFVTSFSESDPSRGGCPDVSRPTLVSAPLDSSATEQSILFQPTSNRGETVGAAQSQGDVNIDSVAAACPDPNKINIACVGDSITFGAHSQGGNTTYPAQLQTMLEAKYPGKYCVVNLGVSGTTMQKSPYGDSPWWRTGAFTQWTTNAKLWHTIVIMLGTNDAKDACPAENCPASLGCGNASFCRANVEGSCCNWPHAGQTNWTEICDDLQCPYAQAYAELISMAKAMGNPKILLAVPPPLMNGGSEGSPSKPYGMNQTVINDILPIVIPKIASANQLPPPIDVFGALGGTSGLDCGNGATKGTSNFLCGHKCVASANDPLCALQCDKQSCDPCHPNVAGYTVLAKTVMEGLGL